MNTYDNERTVLSTVLLSEPFGLQFAEHTELREEYFIDHFHKLVVKEINHARQLGLMDELIVMDALRQKGVMDDFKFSMILAANPFGTEKQFQYQMEILERNELKGIKF